jgi:hypothetical protein
MDLPEEPKPSIQSTYLAIYEISPALELRQLFYLFPCLEILLIVAEAIITFFWSHSRYTIAKTNCCLCYLDYWLQ